MTRTSAFWIVTAVVLAGCGGSSTRVESGNENQILHLGNGADPQDLDPHIVTGVPEHNIIAALFEGLVSEDPKTLKPEPGVAKRWEISDDKTVYTFHLRKDAKWSNGDPVTAYDFAKSYERILTPELAAQYSYMFNDVVNAEAFNNGEIDDFSKVGIKALGKRRLRIELESPTPYFLSMLNHYSWFPVHIPTVKEHGELTERGSPWTRPENLVGNGPFTLEKWRINQVIEVRKSSTYWDAEEVELNGINFYPIENAETEERAFRAGQLHVTEQVPLSKIEYYQKNKPKLFRIDPYLGTYFYRINTNIEPLNDKRVRRALAMAIDRESIVNNVLKGGRKPAYHYTPPNTAGYTAEAHVEGSVKQAKKLLAEAGYPNGKGFPTIEILYNTSEAHRTVAQVIQEMWSENLNIKSTLINQEWKVYLTKQDSMDYEVSRSAWIGDYIDPKTFLDMWVTGGGNNDTGWSNETYDRLIAKADKAATQQERYRLFQKAEKLLMEEMPIIPIYFYTRIMLIRPSVKGWYPTMLDHHPYKYVHLEPSSN